MRHRPPKRRRAAMMRRARTIATRANETWSMDFLADELPDGRRIRLLAIVDNFTRECLARRRVWGSKPIASYRPCNASCCAVAARSASDSTMGQTSCRNNLISGHTGTTSSLTSHGLESRPTTRLSNQQPRPPEFLNVNWSVSLEEVRQLATRWRADYNRNHPHSALRSFSPKAFAEKASKLASQAAKFTLSTEQVRGDDHRCLLSTYEWGTALGNVSHRAVLSLHGRDLI